VKGWNLDTGKHEEFPDTASLTFELYATHGDKIGGVAIPMKMISFGETKEDEHTGMAYPPNLFENED